MYRVWLADVEKAIAAIREKTGAELFCSISGTWNGDFVFEIAEDRKYFVKHDDFSVWINFGDWKNPDWREIK
jgi:hypothetical protein